MQNVLTSEGATTAMSVAAALFTLLGYIVPMTILTAARISSMRRGEPSLSDEMTPLFSVRAGWRAAAGALFSLQTIGLTALLTIANAKPTWGATEIAEFAVSAIAQTGAASAVSTFVLLEGAGGIMTTYDYMRKTVIEPLIERNEAVREKRRAEGRAEGIAIGEAQGEARGKAEGIAEGLAIGEAQGEARMRAQFVAWLARKEDAERQGIPFDEPMPGADPSPNGHSPQP